MYTNVHAKVCPDRRSKVYDEAWPAKTPAAWARFPERLRWYGISYY